MHFHYMTYMAKPQRKNPYPGVMKFTIWVDPFLVIITIYLVCLIYASEERRRFLKGIMYLHYMTYMVTPQRKNPCAGGHEINNLGRLFIGHHNYTLIFSPKHAPEQRRRFLKKNINFTLFTAKLPPPLVALNKFSIFFFYPPPPNNTVFLLNPVKFQESNYSSQ